MDFRWVAGITLWTMLSGPIFVGVQQYTHRGQDTKAQSGEPAWVKGIGTPTLRTGTR